MATSDLRGTEYIEDSAHASGDSGTMPLAVRNDTLASLVSDDGDYAPLQVNATGALYATLDGETVNVKEESLGGASTDGTSALTGADTWVQVPTAAPASDYIMIVSKENFAGTIRYSFTNGGTPSTTNGNKMWGTEMVFRMAASEVMYFGSSTDGDDVNWVTKII